MCEVIMMKRAGSKTWVTRLLVYGLLLMVCIRPSWATTVVKMSDQDIVRVAGIVLEGKVTRVSSQWNAAGTQIHTFVDISVSRVLKGSVQGQTITLRVLGGVVGNIGMSIVDSPTYATGEDIILLLGPNPRSLFPVVGFNQGKFTIEVDPATQQKMVKERRVSRDEFVRHIERILTDQENAAIAAQANQQPVENLEPAEPQEDKEDDGNE